MLFQDLGLQCTEIALNSRIWGSIALLGFSCSKMKNHCFLGISINHQAKSHLFSSDFRAAIQKAFSSGNFNHQVKNHMFFLGFRADIQKKASLSWEFQSSSQKNTYFPVNCMQHFKNRHPLFFWEDLHAVNQETLLLLHAFCAPLLLHGPDMAVMAATAGPQHGYPELIPGKYSLLVICLGGSNCIQDFFPSA